MLELVIGVVISAALAYLISEVNQVQVDVKALLIDVAVLKNRAHKRKTDFD